MGFRCPAPECGTRLPFKSPGALSNHKRTCKGWRRFSESASLKPAEVELLSRRKRRKTLHPNTKGLDPDFIPVEAYNPVADGADASIQPSTLPSNNFQVPLPSFWAYIPVTDISY
jgi:hypothetical protein